MDLDTALIRLLMELCAVQTNILDNTVNKWGLAIFFTHSVKVVGLVSMTLKIGLLRPASLIVKDVEAAHLHAHLLKIRQTMHTFMQRHKITQCL